LLQEFLSNTLHQQGAELKGVDDKEDLSYTLWTLNLAMSDTRTRLRTRLEHFISIYSEEEGDLSRVHRELLSWNKGHRGFTEENMLPCEGVFEFCAQACLNAMPVSEVNLGENS
jgi:hypothetical protein